MSKWDFAKPTICIDIPPDDDLRFNGEGDDAQSPDFSEFVPSTHQRLIGENLGSAEFQWLLQSVYDAVLISYTDGRIASVNSRALQFFRCARETFSHDSVLDLISGAHRNLLNTIRDHVSEDQFALVQAYCARDDGTFFPAEISVNILHWHQNDYLCFFIRDITRRKQAEKKMAQYAQELEHKTQQYEEDLTMAREIQMAMLPRQFPVFPVTAAPETSALKFNQVYIPSGLLGGDFFRILPVSGRRAGILIADVAGHGMRAALVVATMLGLIEQLAEECADPGAFLTELNKAHTRVFVRSHESMFVTAFYGVIDVGSGEMLYATAGHPYPYRIRRKDRNIKPLEFSGKGACPAIGLFEEAEYGYDTTTLTPDEMILLYTDGVTESRNVQGEDFSDVRFKQYLMANLNKPTQRLLNELQDDIRQFTSLPDFQDDVCLLSVEYTP
ncbi:MAG: PAS domain S-box protein [Spartobacteria bacterium]|nr:PAS domain S-box protein [Spartobacteria bacterium]